VEGEWEQSAWTFQDKSCLTNLIVFYNDMAGFVKKEKARDDTHLDFGKIFGTVSYNVLVSMFGHHNQAE